MTGRYLRWVGLAIVVVAVAFSVVLASRFGGDPGLVESPLIGREAPPFDLAALDGSSTVSLADLEGNIVCQIATCR